MKERFGAYITKKREERAYKRTPEHMKSEIARLKLKRKLAQQRAALAKEKRKAGSSSLAAWGIDTSKIGTAGFGVGRPVASRSKKKKHKRKPKKKKGNRRGKSITITYN